MEELFQRTLGIFGCQFRQGLGGLRLNCAKPLREVLQRGIGLVVELLVRISRRGASPAGIASCNLLRKVVQRRYGPIVMAGRLDESLGIDRLLTAQRQSRSITLDTQGLWEPTISITLLRIRL